MALSSSNAIAISANERPIYPRTIFNWAAPLKSEVCPILIGSEVPQLLGNGGQNGALLHGIEVQSLGTNAATAIRFYLQPVSEQGYTLTPSISLRYRPLFQFPVPATVESSNIPIGLYDILPTGNTGFHLAPGESMFAALSNAVSTGLVIWVRGGWY